MKSIDLSTILCSILEQLMCVIEKFWEFSRFPSNWTEELKINGEIVKQQENGILWEHYSPTTESN